MFGLPGHLELLIFLGLALLLFGHRLPQAAQAIGASIGSFRKGVAEGFAEADTDATAGERNR